MTLGDSERLAVLAWPAHWLVELPASVELRLSHPRHPTRPLRLTTSRAAYAAAKAAGVAVLHGTDWQRLTEAAAGKAAALALEQWLVPSVPPPRPPEPPDWTLPPQSLRAALGPTSPTSPTPPGGARQPTVAEVLAHFGCTLESLHWQTTVDTEATL